MVSSIPTYSYAQNPENEDDSILEIDALSKADGDLQSESFSVMSLIGRQAKARIKRDWEADPRHVADAIRRAGIGLGLENNPNFTSPVKRVAARYTKRLGSRKKLTDSPKSMTTPKARRYIRVGSQANLNRFTGKKIEYKLLEWPGLTPNEDRTFLSTIFS